VYLQLKKPAAAEDQFEAASLIDANNLQAQLGAARAQIAEGRASEALDELTPLAGTQTGNPEIFDLLAQAYKSLGKPKEAQDAEARAALLRSKTRQ
jgi:predicted Zn-dependent protease